MKALSLALMGLFASLAFAAPPNVLFIASDDMRPQLGCYGDPVVKSPNLDRLAARGVVMDRAYCQQALCSPSRISLLSGRRPSTTKIWDIGPTLRSKMPDITTLPQHFKNNGYFCRSLGKIYHVGIDDPDSWSVESFVSKVPRRGPEGQKMVSEYVAKMKRENQPIPAKGKGGAPYAGPAWEAPELGDDQLSDGDTCREAIEALRGLAKKPQQPFFLAVGFVNPHVPYVAPKKYFDLYDRNKLVLPDNRFAPRGAPKYAAQSGGDFYWYAGVPSADQITEELGKTYLHAYLAAISYVDALVGRLMETLHETGLDKNTIIVFWGDHGYYMGEHNWWGGKHNNYEGATRVPLIVAVPGMKTAGQHASGIVEFVDLYPTLAELAGLKIPDGLDGQSFAPLLSDPSRQWKKGALSEYPRGGNHGIALVTQYYRYVEWKNKKGEIVDVELYDHQKDPAENQNVAADPAYRQQLDQHAAMMREDWKMLRAN